MSDTWVKAGVIFALVSMICTVLMVPEVRTGFGLEDVDQTHQGQQGFHPPRERPTEILADSFVEQPKQRKVSIYQRQLDVHHPEWTGTHITIHKDQVVSITASGSFRWDATLPAVGPSGTAWKPRDLDGTNEFPLPNEPCASLIAKVGEFTFPVGSSGVIGPGVEGELQLGINERWLPGKWDDNWGLVRMNIHVETI